MSSKVNQQRNNTPKPKVLINKSTIKPVNPFDNVICDNNNGIRVIKGVRYNRNS